MSEVETDSVAPVAEAGTPVAYSHSASFPTVLEETGCSLLVSTYQAGQVVAIGVADGAPRFSFQRFDQAMGLAVGEDQIAVGAKGQVWFLRDHSEFAGRVGPPGVHDRCFLARGSTVTGRIQGHELAWGRGAGNEPQLWMVNTLFSCLALIDPAYSFVPRWRPPFISELAAQDRCHLNGLAMRDGAPAYVTVMARTDEPGGWRKVPIDSGAVLEVATGEPVTTGLAMPHSPRWHNNNLYVLNSGMGRLEQVDVATGSREVVAVLPGYARGLAFHGRLAFIGLSKIRETAIFGGAPIAAYHDQLRCGIGVIDVDTGTTVATLQFTSTLHEIFDVQVLPDTRCPALGGLPAEGDDIWLVPSPSGD